MGYCIKCSHVSPKHGVCRDPCVHKQVFPSSGPPRKLIEHESSVLVGKISYTLRQAHDAYIEYRVGLPQRPAKPLVSPATSPMVENMDGNGQENPLPVFISIFYHWKQDQGWKRPRSGARAECTSIWKRTSMGVKMIETGGNRKLKPGSWSHIITF